MAGTLPTLAATLDAFQKKEGGKLERGSFQFVQTEVVRATFQKETVLAGIFAVGFSPEGIISALAVTPVSFSKEIEIFELMTRNTLFGTWTRVLTAKQWQKDWLRRNDKEAKRNALRAYGNWVERLTRELDDLRAYSQRKGTTLANPRTT